MPVADAVLYLLRHTHSSDLRFLESFHDDEVARGHAGQHRRRAVPRRRDRLARGSTRWRWPSGSRRRYQTDPRLHRLCPVVVPVNGLLGHAAATLREDEYAAAGRGRRSARRSEIAELLLTADRFATAARASLVPVGAAGSPAGPARALRRPARPSS